MDHIKNLLPPELTQQVNREKFMESLEDVPLTEAEAAEALSKALFTKNAKLREIRYMQEVNKPVVIPTFTPEKLIKFLSTQFHVNTGRYFEIDDQNQHVMDILSRYFTGDESISELGYSLKKGIMLLGNVGCGKTTIMKYFAKNPKQSYLVTSCRKPAELFEEYGSPEMERYYSNEPAPANNIFRQENFGYCFDDLGTEETMVKHFGNTKNVMTEILLNRYEKIDSLGFSTHLTTNLSFDEIQSLYGTRVRSRMREMFNVITFDPNAKDRRN